MSRALIFSLFCIGLVGCSRVEPPPKKHPITIAISSSPGYASAFLARDKGLFSKYGVDVQLVFVKEYVPSITLFEQGDVDGAFLAYPDAIMASERGLHVKVVYICDYSVTSDAIIARPEIRSCAGLTGKIIGFEPFAKLG